MARPPSTPAATPTTAASSAPGAEALPASYEDAMAELEQLVVRMESGALPLEQLLVAYQRGASLLGFCRERLQAVEDQVKQLEGGQLKPWDAA
jgi:exodeoxyribonuclease VII small subunit